MTRSLWMAPLAALLLAGTSSAGDWANWRGPEYDGHSLEKNLPSKWSPAEAGKDNLIWKAPYGSRSAPIVLDGRLYLIQGYGDGVQLGERVVCLDAESGKLLWTHEFEVYHTDIVVSRTGWASPCGDPKTGYVFVHGTQGHLFCLDKEGKVVWERQLTEEFGRVTGYGGRICNPVVIEDVVIMGIANGSWGSYARGWNRWLAFDTKTGEVVWVAQTPEPIPMTYYSNPVPAVIDGQLLMIAGGSDGGLHAFQARTGKHVWTYPVADGIVNGSPIVDGNLIYITHGESNLDSATLGRVVCVDASKLDKAGKPTLVWEYKGKRFGLASAALADGVLYCPDDFATLYNFDAKTGKLLGRESYGRVARGSPLVADGKLYIFDVNAAFHIYEITGPGRLDELHYQKFINPNVVGFVETNGTPIAVNGKVYLATIDECYCIGLKDAEHPKPDYKQLPPEKAAPEGFQGFSQLQILPAEVTLHPGEKTSFSLRYFNADGQQLDTKNVRIGAEFSIATPPGGKGPAEPPLNAKLNGNQLTVSADVPNQQGYILAKVGEQTAMARVRVATKLPYKETFDRYPLGACPGGYVYAQGKFVVKELGGDKVFMKTNNSTRPPLARANAYLTTPDAANYTIEADVYGTEVRGKLPDGGVINSRYQLTLEGKADPATGKRMLRLGSWEAVPRIAQAVEYQWEPKTWYRLKLKVVPMGDSAVISAKVWPRDKEEPAKPTIEFTDPNPNLNGAAALYGFVTNTLADPNTPNFEGSELYFDNVAVTPNQ